MKLPNCASDYGDSALFIKCVSCSTPIFLKSLSTNEKVCIFSGIYCNLIILILPSIFLFIAFWKPRLLSESFYSSTVFNPLAFAYFIIILSDSSPSCTCYLLDSESSLRLESSNSSILLVI